MNNFEYSPYQVSQKLTQLKRDAFKSIGGTTLGRHFRAFKRKRDNNQAFRDWTDILLYWAWLGILVGAIAAVSIVEQL
jgi:hypothetical protein